MNSSLVKTIIYFVVISLIVAFLIYFYKNLTNNNLDDIEIETAVIKDTKALIKTDMDLELFEDDKFINLKGSDSNKPTFRAGRRNPFEPYD